MKRGITVTYKTDDRGWGFKRIAKVKGELTIEEIIHQRTGHKLDEWNKFVEILKTLPYVKEIGGLDEESS